MQVVVVGATGLIGSAVVARLLAAGHDVTGIARDVRQSKVRFPQVRWVSLALSRRNPAGAWAPYLAGADALVNCAGALQSGPLDSVDGVHEDGPAVLFAACEHASVRRVIHFSAIGVDRETPTAFSRSKLEGDEALMRHDLDWVILRPSVVVGSSAYGGSALFRGLAALPIQPVMPGPAPLQIVQLDQVVETVLFFLGPEAPSRVTLELVGPERLSFAEVVRRYRRWLGFGEARLWSVPGWLSALLYWLGDFAGLLGWQPPIRSTARLEIARGAVGDPMEWTRITGIVPRSLGAALAAEPASVQERWFAGLYFTKALLFTILSLFWIVTGIISLGPGWDIGVGYMLEGGAGAFAAPSVTAGAVADIAIGLAIAFRPTARYGLYAALAISIFYAIAGTVVLPRLWLDPLGPMLKIWPILVLNLVALAIIKDR